MAALTAQQMARMRATQQAHMMDKGHVMRFVSGERDAHGVKRPHWIKQPVTVCGFQFANQTDEVLGRSDVPTIDAELRLPFDTEICKWDRWRLTHRLGVVQNAVTEYEIIGEPRQGPSGIVCDLQLAQDVIDL